MPARRWIVVGNFVAVALVLSAAILSADAGEDFEIAILGGTTRFEQALTAYRAKYEPTVGLRGGLALTSHLTWFIDALYATTDVASFRKGAAVLTGRTGVEYVFQADRDARWFVGAGGGHLWIDFDEGQDYDNFIYSAGGGQMIRIGRRTRLRWELRVDVCVSRGGWYKTLNDSKIMVGLVW